MKLTSVVAKIAISLIVLLLIGSCKKQALQLPRELVFEQTYRLINIGSKHVDAQNAPTIAFKDNGRITGSGGCNQYISSYELGDKNAITIQQAIGTLMMCTQDLMQQEHTFLQMLPTMTRYEIDNKGRLVLYPGSGKLLAFVLDN